VPGRACAGAGTVREALFELRGSLDEGASAGGIPGARSGILTPQPVLGEDVVNPVPGVLFGMHLLQQALWCGTGEEGMNDERKLLEQRLAWLEREMIRLLWAAIGGLSLVVGGIAYTATIN